MVGLEVAAVEGVREKVVELDIRAALGRGLETLMEEVEDHTTEAQIKQTQLVINLEMVTLPSPKFSIY